MKKEIARKSNNSENNTKDRNVKASNSKGSKSLLLASCVLIFIISYMFTGALEIEAGQIEEVDNTSKYEEIFMVGMMDLTLLFNDLEKNIEDINMGDQFEDKIKFTGRTAFFLKGKIRGKYLLTVKLDTNDVKLNDICQNLFSQIDEN
ncbi:MAG: hypothetical protein ACLFPF_10185, partial [Halanaerobiales bacterium]